MSRMSPAPHSLSVIIPCWNDDVALGTILECIAGLRGIDEVIVADASASSKCAGIAGEHGVALVRCEQPNRGAQMNAGAQVANGELLLFQHADTELTQGHVDALRAIRDSPEVVGGAFHRKFDSRHERLRWLEPWARLWATLGGSFFGDQSIFVRRAAFDAMGGYAAIPLMEDLEFCRRLRRMGKTRLLDPAIGSSPRHAKRFGSWRTTIRNGGLITLYRLGVSPHTLHRWYYRLPKNPHPGPVPCASPAEASIYE
jgi:rSAM/selenodomain-associated transferase 2